MKLSVLFLLVVASLSAAVASSSPKPQPPTGVEGRGDETCDPKCKRRKDRLLRAALPVGTAKPPAGPPKKVSAVDKPFDRSASIPVGPPSSYGFPSGPRGPPAPSSSFQSLYFGAPGPRLDVYGGMALPPPGRGPGSIEVQGPPGITGFARFCRENEVFVGHNVCICAKGFIRGRKNLCRPLRKPRGK